MATRATLGIDLGTSSVKVNILDTRGRVIGEGKREYAVTSPQPGWAEGDPGEWWRATAAAVRVAIEQTPQASIAAIGLSGQMHGVVLVDQQGQPLRPALLWPDGRAVEELALYRALSPVLLRSLANPLAPGMAGPLLCWLMRHEATTYQAAAWALQPKDWLRLRLTGQVASEASDASATLLYDVPANRWADDVIAALGLRNALFASLAPAEAMAGTLTTQAAAQLSLEPGLPVATGAADTAAALLGTGLLEPGPIQLTIGTGAQLVQLTAEPAIDPTSRTHLYRAADGVNWYKMAAVQNAGLTLDWMCKVLAVGWDELYASGATVPPGAHGVTFVPYITKERAHVSSKFRYGAFLGLRSDHRREHLLHAALEGVAFNIRSALEALPGAEKSSRLQLAGGGSVHPAWRQMLADALNRELMTVDMTDASARGAALLGGIAGGIWQDARATTTIAPDVYKAATPDPERARAYDDIFAHYVQMS